MTPVEDHEGGGLLAGARILIVEDEMVIALDMAQCLGAHGAEIVGPCNTVAAALSVAERAPLTAAVLDVRVGRSSTASVAKVLAARGIPYVICSGQSRSEIRTQFEELTFLVLEKPVSETVLVDEIVQMVGAAGH